MNFSATSCIFATMQRAHPSGRISASAYILFVDLHPSVHQAQKAFVLQLADEAADRNAVYSNHRCNIMMRPGYCKVIPMIVLNAVGIHAGKQELLKPVAGRIKCDAFNLVPQNSAFLHGAAKHGLYKIQILQQFKKVWIIHQVKRRFLFRNGIPCCKLNGMRIIINLVYVKLHIN